MEYLLSIVKRIEVLDLKERTLLDKIQFTESINAMVANGYLIYTPNEQISVLTEKLDACISEKTELINLILTDVSVDDLNKLYDKLLREPWSDSKVNTLVIISELKKEKDKENDYEKSNSGRNC